jgi:hypothetical protein
MKLFIDNFPDRLNKALKKRAIDEGVSKAELIIRLIRQGMKRTEAGEAGNDKRIK